MDAVTSRAWVAGSSSTTLPAAAIIATCRSAGSIRVKSMMLSLVPAHPAWTEITSPRSSHVAQNGSKRSSYRYGRCGAGNEPGALTETKPWSRAHASSATAASMSCRGPDSATPNNRPSHAAVKSASQRL
jgi:hypothetical protein